MPAIFLGHGSPMNTLEDNHFTASWRRIGRQLPTPRAVLVVSAHWYIDATAVTAMEKPRTIHDFSGFPEALRRFQYPAPGAPEVAAEVAEVVKPTSCELDNNWGIDHGAWSVLAHLFPAAEVPILQLSLNAAKPPAYHFDLATALAPLRDRGVLILASGNVVHNLRRVNFGMRGKAFDWAERFDDAAREVMVTSPGDVLRLFEHPGYNISSPTPDHFLPLVTLAGLAAAADTTPDVLVEGYDLGALSMTSYGLGLE